jgi:hypothetical protein
MALFLLSLIVATILVAISIFRHHIAFGSINRSEIAREGFSIAEKRADLSTVAGSMNQFLVVVLPDGKIVIQRVVDQL